MDFDTFAKILWDSPAGKAIRATCDHKDPAYCRFRRAVENFGLDLPEWSRTCQSGELSSDWLREHGPNVPESRDSTFTNAICEEGTVLKLKGAENVIALWKELHDIAKKSGLLELCCVTNQRNKTHGLNGHAIKYVHCRSFTRYLPDSRVSGFGARRKRQAWDAFEDRHQEFFDAFTDLRAKSATINITVNEQGATTFVTSESDAPHLGLAPELPETLRTVVRKMGIPGFETSKECKINGGLLAIRFPLGYFQEMYRPTILDALKNPVFFLPSKKDSDTGRTLPLNQALNMSDLSDEARSDGVREWVGVVGSSFPIEIVTIEMIGTTDGVIV